jgi:hypothetical protein
MSYVAGDPPGTQWLKRQKKKPLRSRHLDDAMRDMKLTPQEQYLYQHHLNNLYGSGKIWNKDGSTSTILQDTIEINGKTYNIPTVWDGKELSGFEATKRAAAEGMDNWPAYSSDDEAQNRYDKMHSYMERDMGDWHRQAMDAWQPPQ